MSSPRLVHLPIRTLETLTAGGGRVHGLSVACPMRGGAVGLETCRVCPHLAAIDDDPASTAGVVHCRPKDDAETGDGDATSHRGDGDATSHREEHVAGCALAHAAPSVRDDVTLQELTSFFVQQGVSRVAVVDEEARLVGIITERDLIVGEILEYSRLSEVPAGKLARGAYSVTEATSLRDALRTMARHQLREIPVVSHGGQFTGWLEDLEALDALRPL
jgi:CBS domain-containing protein